VTSQVEQNRNRVRSRGELSLESRAATRAISETLGGGETDSMPVVKEGGLRMRMRMRISTPTSQSHQQAWMNDDHNRNPLTVVSSLS
jgi:hypothetical protein